MTSDNNLSNPRKPAAHDEASGRSKSGGKDPAEAHVGQPGLRGASYHNDKESEFPPAGTRTAMEELLPLVSQLSMCAHWFFSYVEVLEKWLSNFNSSTTADRRLFIETTVDDPERFEAWFQYQWAYAATLKGLGHAAGLFEGQHSEEKGKDDYFEYTWFMVDGHLTFYQRVLTALEDLDQTWIETGDLINLTRSRIDHAEAVKASVPSPPFHTFWDSMIKALVLEFEEGEMINVNELLPPSWSKEKLEEWMNHMGC